jgi:hypothetical protein
MLKLTLSRIWKVFERGAVSKSLPAFGLTTAFHIGLFSPLYGFLN